MKSGVIAVVLCHSVDVAGAALGIDHDAAVEPVGRGLSTMAADAVAGSIKVKHGRPAGLGIIYGLDRNIDYPVKMILVAGPAVFMAGGADVMDGSSVVVRQMGADIRRFAVAGNASGWINLR